MANDFDPILIPPGGGGGAPLGAGPMMANTLQQILAQRRAQEQQSLINQLTQQKQNAEIQHWQNEDAYNKESREALTDSRRQTTIDKQDALSRTKKQAENWTAFKTQLVPGNPLFDTLPPDQQRGATILSNFEYDHPLVQDFMKRVITPESPKNDLVPAFRKNEDTGDLTPDMIDAVPPRVGKEQRQATRGSEISTYRPHHETPGQSQGLEIVDDKDPTKKSTFFVSGRFTGTPTPPPGSHFSGLRVGTDNPRANTKPTPTYDKQALFRYTSSIGKPTNKKAREDFIASITDQHMKDDVRAVLNDPVAAKKPTLDIIKEGRISAPPGLPPEETQAYMDTITDMLLRARGI